MESMIKNLLPYMAIVVIDVLLISYLPIISIGLPELFGMM